MTLSERVHLLGPSSSDVMERLITTIPKRNYQHWPELPDYDCPCFLIKAKTPIRDLEQRNFSENPHQLNCPPPTSCSTIGVHPPPCPFLRHARRDPPRTCILTHRDPAATPIPSHATPSSPVLRINPQTNDKGVATASHCYHYLVTHTAQLAPGSGCYRYLTTSASRLAPHLSRHILSKLLRPDIHCPFLSDCLLVISNY